MYYQIDEQIFNQTNFEVFFIWLTIIGYLIYLNTNITQCTHWVICLWSVES